MNFKHVDPSLTANEIDDLMTFKHSCRHSKNYSSIRKIIPPKVFAGQAHSLFFPHGSSSGFTPPLKTRLFITIFAL